MTKVINRFTGDYKFLSNFYYKKFIYNGETYRTAEHAFQAAKTLSRAQHVAIKGADSPGAAKRMGRKCTLRPDWDLVKYNTMRRILKAKFSDKDLAKMLIATGDAELIEGNNWGDTYWGTCNGHGANNLGKLLMEIRGELQNG